MAPKRGDLLVGRRRWNSEDETSQMCKVGWSDSGAYQNQQSPTARPSEYIHKVLGLDLLNCACVSWRL